MALRLFKLYTIRVCVILLAVALLIFCSDAKSQSRPLFRAHEHEKVPDSYFVHLRNHVPLESVHELVRELHRRSSQEGSFKAYVPSIITRAGYGFPAQLSKKALNYVSACEGV